MRGERGERNRGWESVRHRERFQAGPQQISTRMRDGQHNHRNQTNWRDQRGITSYYFTRFADDINEKVLWQHFKRWGDVREVFISKQTNENGRRYGFVRYKDVKDEYRLERQLDSIVVGGLKLYVNLPRFGRRNGGNRSQGAKRQEQQQVKITEAWSQKQRGEGANKSTYVEVVAGKRNTAKSREGGSSSVYLEPSDEMLKWLKDAWVGRLSNPAKFDKVEDELRWDYGVDISAKYMGDDMVLLLGLNEASAENLLHEDSHGTPPLFIYSIHAQYLANHTLNRKPNE